MPDLAGHDRARDALLLEKAQHPAQLADVDPFDLIGRLANAEIRLFANGNDGKRHAGTAGSIEDEKRKPAIAGDHSISHKLARTEGK